MTLNFIDWLIIIAFFIIYLSIGIFVSRSVRNTNDYFLSGRNMSWWLLGISMVATTFSADTPNLVTGLVRENGVSGNWGWWAFLLTGMLTVFVYAKLWKRSNIMTDIEFYELRYSGRPAAFLRGFRALYLGLIFNVLVMGTVSLAAIKFGEIILGLEGWQTLLIAGSITLIYSALGGLKAVVITDLVQFTIAMVGSIWASIYLINIDEIGGLTNLITHENVTNKLSVLPSFEDPSVWIPVLLVPLAVQWWTSYYPGAEPGGGGYIAQRMFSAKNEQNAMGATLLYNIAHYALRPWPWILIALASLIIFPELTDLQKAFPNLPSDKLGHDVAYPAMLSLLPTGLLGLVAASLIAAYMSTMSTQLNLGASYLVNDFYKRFIKPQASESNLVWTGRIFTVISMVLGTSLGLLLTDASQAFNLLLLLGAGTGLIFILRWFWWRINAYTEITAMISSLIIAGYLTFYHDQTGFFPMLPWVKTIFGVFLTTIVWVIATYVTPKTDQKTLINFYLKIKPSGPGWKHIAKETKNPSPIPNSLPLGLAGMVVGCTVVYSALFATGQWIYGIYTSAIFLTVLIGLGTYILFKIWKKLKQIN